MAKPASVLITFRRAAIRASPFLVAIALFVVAHVFVDAPVGWLYVALGVAMLIAMAIDWDGRYWSLSPIRFTTVLAGAYARGTNVRLEWPRVRVGEDRLVVESYPYRFSSFFGKSIEIEACRISCIFQSRDCGVVVDGREILFLANDIRPQLDAFAQRHAIATPPIPEVWSIIAEPFIDQPYETEERDFPTLEDLGCDRQETKTLRDKIEPVMLASTFFTMEWGQHTTEDILRAFILLAPRKYTSDFYWTVMELALRPYKKLPIPRDAVQK